MDRNSQRNERQAPTPARVVQHLDQLPVQSQFMSTRLRHHFPVGRRRRFRFVRKAQERRRARDGAGGFFGAVACLQSYHTELTLSTWPVIILGTGLAAETRRAGLRVPDGRRRQLTVSLSRSEAEAVTSGSRAV
jgi:hypothetical protein